jgi:DNA polymerase III alpha subunit
MWSCSGTAARGSAVEPELVRWAYDHDAPLVATNDVYYGAPAMYEAHDALLCIADGDLHRRGEPAPGHAGTLVQARRA